MRIATPLQADHQLDQLAGQFAHWRQTRTHPYGRIPQTLWEQAVALAAALPPSCVAKQLRVRLADLKKPHSIGFSGRQMGFDHRVGHLWPLSMTPEFSNASCLRC